jgi:hypothetical protein
MTQAWHFDYQLPFKWTKKNGENYLASFTLRMVILINEE